MVLTFFSRNIPASATHVFKRAVYAHTKGKSRDYPDTYTLCGQGSRGISPFWCRSKDGIFRENKVNITAANALAPCIASTSATMVLSASSKHAFHETWFQRPAPICVTDLLRGTALWFQATFTHDKGILWPTFSIGVKQRSDHLSVTKGEGEELKYWFIPDNFSFLDQYDGPKFRLSRFLQFNNTTFRTKKNWFV